MRTLLFLAVFGSFALIGVQARRNRDDNSKAESGEIEQCQCSKLDGCRESARARHTPCIDRCSSKLSDRDWNADEGRRCFDQEPSEEFKECEHQISLKSCASESGVMLNRSEAIPWRRRRRAHRRTRAAATAAALNNNDIDEDANGDEDDDDEQQQQPSSADESPSGNQKGGGGRRRGGGGQHRAREHNNRRNFHEFMTKNFGKSGGDFVKCMQKCGRAQHRGSCPRELKCGLKRIPRDEYHDAQANCHKMQKPRRFAVCECLQKAGKKGLDCSFGRKKDE